MYAKADLVDITNRVGKVIIWNEHFWADSLSRDLIGYNAYATLRLAKHPTRH